MPTFVPARLLLSAFVLALAGCADERDDQHNASAVADVDVLPPDETVDTPTEDLANGAIENEAAAPD